MVRGRGERAEARRPVTGHAAADTTSSLEGRSHRAPVRRRRDLESAKVRRTPGGEGGGGTSTHGTVPWWVVVSPRGRAGRAGRVGLPESLSSYTSILFSVSCLSLGSSAFALALALHNTLARFRKKVPRSQRFGWRREILRGGLRRGHFQSPYGNFRDRAPRHQHPNQHGAAEG